jgi:hypothetical protein
MEGDRRLAKWEAEYKPAPGSHMPLESWSIAPEGLLVACWCERFSRCTDPDKERCCIVNEDGTCSFEKHEAVIISNDM